MTATDAKAESLLNLASGTAAKGASLLVAGGYVSLRAHLNYLGVSGPAYLGVERYLMEAYLFAAGMFDVLVWLALPLLAAFVAWSLPRAHRRAPWAALADRIGAAERQMLPLAPLLFLLLLLALLLAMPADSDVIVGELRKKTMPVRAPHLYRIAVIAMGCWCLLVVRTQARPALRSAMFWGAAGSTIAHALILSITLGYALAVALAYGREMHPTAYPIARVALKDAPGRPLCGIVVLHWADGIMLWQAVQGRGRIVSLPLDGASTIDWGETRDVIASLPAAGMSGTVPDCAGDFSP